MNKQELILKLTDKLRQVVPGEADAAFNSAYNAAITEAICVARNLDESVPTPSAGTNSLHAIVGCLRAKLAQKLKNTRNLTLHEADEYRIAKHLQMGEKLAAVKVYKDATGMFLKECKDDLDLVILSLNLPMNPTA